MDLGKQVEQRLVRGRRHPPAPGGSRTFAARVSESGEAKGVRGRNEEEEHGARDWVGRRGESPSGDQFSRASLFPWRPMGPLVTLAPHRRTETGVTQAGAVSFEWANPVIVVTLGLSNVDSRAHDPTISSRRPTRQ